MTGRTQLAEADTLLVAAAKRDERGIYPVADLDIAPAEANQPGDHATAARHFRHSVTGHLTMHGKLPYGIYDEMVLFGDNERVSVAA